MSSERDRLWREIFDSLPVERIIAAAVLMPGAVSGLAKMFGDAGAILSRLSPSFEKRPAKRSIQVAEFVPVVTLVIVEQGSHRKACFVHEQHLQATGRNVSRHGLRNG